MFGEPLNGRVWMETHAHTAETSSCSRVSGAELVRELKKNGFGAVVVTDHFGPYGYTSKEDRSTFLRGFHKAEHEGRRIGVSVLPGMEIRFESGNEDFLVYGMEETDIIDLPDDVCKAGLHEFHNLAREKGWLIYQAHPYRSGLRTAPANDIDGVEAINAQPRHDSRNRLAMAFARRFRLLTMVGGDIHWLQDIGLVATMVPQEALTPRAFAAWLKCTETPPYEWQEAPVDGIRFTIGAVPNAEMLSVLYKDVGWSAYLEDPGRTLEGVCASQRVVVAWDDTSPVGLARCVGDGKTILVIQDLLVMSEFRGRGIGKGLLRRLITGFKDVGQIILIADKNPEVHTFLRNNGFETITAYNSEGYIYTGRSAM